MKCNQIDEYKMLDVFRTDNRMEDVIIEFAQSVGLEEG